MDGWTGGRRTGGRVDGWSGWTGGRGTGGWVVGWLTILCILTEDCYCTNMSAYRPRYCKCVGTLQKPRFYV